MKRTIITCSIFFSCIHPLWGTPPEVIEVESNVSHLSQLLTHLKGEKTLNKIALITDVDGVITRHSTPPLSGKAEARGHMPLVLRDVCKNGIYTVFSSAWSPFSQTIQRLEELGVANLAHTKKTFTRLMITEVVTPPVKEDSDTVSAPLSPSSTSSTAETLKDDVESKSPPKPENRFIEVAQQGRVVSCRYVQPLGPKKPKRLINGMFEHEGQYYLPCLRNPYFRLKHLSLENAYDHKDPHWDVVVFADDSKTNRRIFKAFMSNTLWYPHVKKVYILNYSSIHGEVLKEDILPQYKDEMPLKPSCESESSEEDEGTLTLEVNNGYISECESNDDTQKEGTSSVLTSETSTPLSDDEARQYLKNYADLRKAAPKGTEDVKLAWAKRHYLKHGIKEGRSFTLSHPPMSDDEARQYLANYRDLRNAAPKGAESVRLAWAKRHYVNHGIREKRTYKERLNLKSQE